MNKSLHVDADAAPASPPCGISSAVFRMAASLLLGIILLAGSLLSPSACAEETLDAEQMAKRFTPCVMILYCAGADDANRTWLGTGFLLTADGLMATNYHMVDGVGEMQAKSASGGAYAVKRILAVDKDHDIAIIQIDGKGLPCVELGDSDATPAGSKVTVIGNPMGLESSVTEGIVSAHQEEKPWGQVIQISAPISHGSSGSPVFNAHGKVIAIAAGGRAQGQALNFAVPSNEIATLFEKAKNVLKDGGKSNAGGKNGNESGDDTASSGRTTTGKLYVPGTAQRGSKEQDKAAAADARYAKFKDYENTYDYFSMLSVAKQLVKDYPRSALCYRGLSDAYYYMRMGEDSTSAVRTAIDLDPDSPRGWNNLAILYYHYYGDIDSSVAAYEKAVKMAPDDVKLLIDYADLVRNVHRDVAISAITHAKQLLLNGEGTDAETRTYSLHAQVVNAMLSFEQKEEAFAAAMEFLKKDTSSARLYIAYAAAAVATKRFTYVNATLDKALSMDSRLNKATLKVRAESDFAQGNREAAINDFSKSYSLDSKDTYTMRCLCYLIADKNKLSNRDLTTIKFYLDRVKSLDPKQGAALQDKLSSIFYDRQDERWAGMIGP